MTHERLLKLLKEYEIKYHNPWPQYADFRSVKGNDFPDWPDWCYCPLAGSYAVVSQYAKDIQTQALDTAIMGALSAWRMTKSIYKYDKDIFKMLWETSIKKIPSDVIYRLPEWCVYIEVPNGYTKPSSDDKIYGWFCHLEFDAKDYRSELRFIIDHGDYYMPMILHLTGDTLDDGLMAFIKESEKISKEIGLYREDESKILVEHKDEYLSLISAMLSVTLYICSDEIDIEGKRQKPHNPATKKVKKGLREFPLEPTSWDVGYRVMRNVKISESSSESPNQAQSNRKAKRPHFRKAHWHSYWTGKRDSEDRKLIIKWMPPIFVNTEKSDSVPIYKEVE